MDYHIEMRLGEDNRERQRKLGRGWQIIRTKRLADTVRQNEKSAVLLVLLTLQLVLNRLHLHSTFLLQQGIPFVEQDIPNGRQMLPRL